MGLECKAEGPSWPHQPTGATAVRSTVKAVEKQVGLGDPGRVQHRKQRKPMCVTCSPGESRLDTRLEAQKGEKDLRPCEKGQEP